MSASHHVRYAPFPLIQLDPGTPSTVCVRVFRPAPGEVVTSTCNLGFRFEQLMI